MDHGVLIFRGSSGKDSITYGQAGHRFEMLSHRPIETGRRCRRVGPGSGGGAFADTPFWIVCSKVHSTRWALGRNNDEVETSKFMPGPYFMASAPSVMRGGGGNDHLVGSFGHDVLIGGRGNDGIAGGRGQDVFIGGAGDDSMGIAGNRLEPLSGSPGETFHGGPGNDAMRGGNGNDVLLGGPGDDGMAGGPGADRFVGGSGGDTIIGGGGSRDVLDYSARTGAISVTDDGVANDGASGEGDNVMPADQSGVTHGTEIIEAGSGDDTIEMSGPRVRLHGNAGSDELLVDGGPGAAFGGPGDDTLTVSGALGRLRGGVGDDTLSSSDASADRDGCGPGTDDVTADATDVVNANCENVTVTP